MGYGLNVVLAARAEGESGAPPLVLLHAIATSSQAWHPQIAVWAQRFRVLAIDLPGHGGSAKLATGGGLSEFADAVAATMAAHGLNRASVVGLSLGSMVAQRLAAAHPDRVTAAVLANGVAFAADPVRAAWRQRIADAEREGMAAQAGDILSRWFTPGFLANAPLTVARIRHLIQTTPVAGFVDAAAAIASLDQRALLASITCPTLVLAGEQDIAAPAAAVKAIAEAVPSARFATLPAPHLSNVELPTAFTETVGAFLLQTIAA